MSKRINSKQKGSRGERALRDQFREAGFTARRSQQYCGAGATSDVIVEELSQFHIECKNTEAKAFLDWLDQAERDSQEKIPIVCHKHKNRDWIAILPLDKLITIIRRSDMVQSRRQ